MSSGALERLHVATCLCGLLAGCAAADRSSTARPVEPQVLDDAIRRGASWLVARQPIAGAFAAEGAGDSAVLPAAVALWAMVESRADVREPELLRGAAALFAYRRPDGGIYSFSGRLGMLESRVAACALAAVESHVGSDQIRQFRSELEEFLRRSAEQESARSLAPAEPRGTLSGEGLDPAEAEALRFLSRVRPPAAAESRRIGAENVAVAAPPQPAAMLRELASARVWAAGASQSWGRAEFDRDRDAGMIAASLLRAQRPDGSWAAGERQQGSVVETSCALLALASCARAWAQAAP